MPKIQRMYETKQARARCLPAGSWFVHPDPTPRRQTRYYRPRLYYVQADQTPMRMDEDIGLWDSAGPNSPEAAHARLAEHARILNRRRADAIGGAAYLAAIHEQAQRDAIAAVAERMART